MSRLRFPRITFRAGTLGFGLLSAGIFGIALFLAIADLGFARIWDEIVAIGPGLLGIILVHVGQLAFCALAWHALFAVPAGLKRPGLPRLLQMRWLRESIDSLLPVAQIGGELAAARLVARRGLPLPLTGASVIADVTVETLTQAIYTLIGLGLLYMLADPGDVLRWAALGFAIAVVFAALAVFAQRLGGVRLFEKILLAIADRTGWSRLEGIAGLDRALGQVYRLRARLFLAGLYHLAAWSLGAGEVMIAAYALGYHPTLGQAYVIECLAQAVRSAAFFVPGAVGVQEGGFVLLAGLFGIPADAAISISLSKRVRELALGLPGLGLWQLLEFRSRAALQAAHTMVALDRKAV
jgi:putative membrane protein